MTRNIWIEPSRELTLATLEKLGAPEEVRDGFRKLFGDRVLVTTSLCVRYDKELARAWNWLARNLLSRRAYLVYMYSLSSFASWDYDGDGRVQRKCEATNEAYAAYCWSSNAARAACDAQAGAAYNRYRAALAAFIDAYAEFAEVQAFERAVFWARAYIAEDAQMMSRPGNFVSGTFNAFMIEPDVSTAHETKDVKVLHKIYVTLKQAQNVVKSHEDPAYYFNGDHIDQREIAESLDEMLAAVCEDIEQLTGSAPA